MATGRGDVTVAGFAGGPIVEPEPLAGAQNMARDEALLEAAASGTAGLRLYRWAEPTLSLGYFQKQRPADPLLAPLPAVRRLSGGGAIVHDREWTYALALPRTHPLARRPTELYDLVHGLIISAFAAIGLPLRRRGEARVFADGEPFLCFARGDERDLVFDLEPLPDGTIASTKIVGSAQRRRRGAILQHGSMLTGRSTHAPSLPGLSDLAPRLADRIDEAVTDFASRLARSIGGMPPDGRRCVD